MKWSTFGALSLYCSLATASPRIGVDTIHNDAAPVLSSTNSKPVPDSYIIVFKDHVTGSQAESHHNWIRDVHVSTESSKAKLRRRSQVPLMDNVFRGLKHTYNLAGGLMGYSGHFDQDVIERIRKHPDVCPSALNPRLVLPLTCL